MRALEGMKLSPATHEVLKNRLERKASDSPEWKGNDVSLSNCKNKACMHNRSKHVSRNDEAREHVYLDSNFEVDLSFPEP